MLDFLLVVIFLVVLNRGYRRGLVREAADLFLIVAGAVVAFRTGDSSSAFIQSWTGSSPIVARLLGGFAVFFLFHLVGAYALNRALPTRAPLKTAERVAGVVVAAAWFVVGVTMFLLVASAAPMGQTAQRLLAESKAVEFVAGDNSTAKDVVSAIVGDRILEALVNLNQFVGDDSVVINGEETIVLPAIEGELIEARDDAEAIFDLLNLARIGEGLDPLAWGGALSEVAAGHSFEMYRDGYFSHLSPKTGTVDDRIEAAGIPYRIVGENLALSPTPESVHEGLLASPGHREIMLDPRFTRVGISAIDGPLGLMVVQVFFG